MADANNTRGLSILDAIYRFAGGLRSSGQVDIERPVQVVHDVSHAAGVITTKFLFHIEAIVTDASGNPNYDVQTAQQILDVAGETWQYRATQTDIWLLDVNGWVTSASVGNFVGSAAFAGIARSDVAPGVAIPDDQRAVLAGLWDASQNNLVEAGSAYQPLQKSTPRSQLLTKLPRRIERMYFSATDDGVAAANVQFRLLYALTPRGIVPQALVSTAS